MGIKSVAVHSDVDYNSVKIFYLEQNSNQIKQLNYN
jgi:hypothetical protein